MLWLLLLAVALFYAYLKLYKPTQYWKERGVPCFESWPLVGNMLPFVLRKSDMFSMLKTFYGNIEGRYCGMHQFLQPILLIKDVELIKDITIKDFEHFLDHKSFFSESQEPVFSENLFSSTGQNWRELRTTLSPAFTGSKMRAMYILIAECSERFIAHYKKFAVPNKVISLEMKEIFKRFTIDVIGTCAYGVESDSLKNKNNDFYVMGNDTSNFGGIRNLKMIGFMINPILMRFFKVRVFSDDHINFFMNIVKKTISYREEHGISRPDLIHLMMEARKGKLKYEETSKDTDTGFATVEESEVGKKTSNLEITDNLIVAQAMIFFIGGTDTTSTLLSFATHELAINEDVQKKLQKEIDYINDETKGKLTYEALAKMKYLDMVVSESLRKWPQAFFIDRLCVKDYTIQPTTPGEQPLEIKKGEIVWFPVVGYHYDPKYFPNPERFDPERFNDENKGNINPYMYLPFGLGPRSCIGNRFALLVVKTFLFNILRTFDIVVTEKTQIPLQIKKSEIMVNSAKGFHLGFKLRS